MVEKYGVKGVEALQLILAERAAKGWGALSNAEFDEKKLEATIIVQDLFECLALKGENKEAKSRFFRGYLAGAFNQLYNKEVSAREVECIARKTNAANLS
ncbi:4-vinyl reductase [Candidatus Bathyarchaeota archaeon]|nr:4-vinyl reductase [Candidatus Bathyarchaeota archaeon]